MAIECCTISIKSCPNLTQMMRTDSTENRLYIFHNGWTGRRRNVDIYLKFNPKRSEIKPSCYKRSNWLVWILKPTGQEAVTWQSKYYLVNNFTKFQINWPLVQFEGTIRIFFLSLYRKLLSISRMKYFRPLRTNSRIFLTFLYVLRRRSMYLSILFSIFL